MTLDDAFEQKLKEALLDDVERTLRHRIGPQLLEAARENWIEYANRNDYDIDHIWEDVEGPVVERTGDNVQLRLEWPGLTALFECGVSPHTIEGNPLLSFHWAAPPEGTRPPGAPEHVTAESVNWGSVTGGIPASRSIRNALDDVRRGM